MEQKWRIYAPEGRDISRDVKMTLRTMSNYAPFFGRGEIFVSPIARNDYLDDVYTMDVNGERVVVVAREQGQRAYTEEVFGDLDKGIFFNVSDENVRAAESKLVKAFG